MDAQAVLDQARQLGIELRADGDSIRYRPKSAAPEAFVEALRQHKPQVIALLQVQARPTMRDIPFPTGYAGLPQDPVALGEKVMDSLDIHEPVLRKYNVLSFVLSWFWHNKQNLETGAFDDPEIARLYNAVKVEKARLLVILQAELTGRKGRATP